MSTAVDKQYQRKKTALATQLKFRKTVLQQQYPDKSVYNVSKAKGKNLSVEDLKHNVGRLVEAAFSSPVPGGTHILIGKRVKHKFGSDGAVQMNEGKVISVVPGFASWYNIKYDEDPAIYTYRLMDDYQAGNLEIIPTVSGKIIGEAIVG